MNGFTVNQVIHQWVSKTGIKMDPNKIYDSLCSLVKEPVVFPLKDNLGNVRYIIGHWINISEIKPEDNCILPGKRVAIQVLGEGNSWEEAAEKAFKILSGSNRQFYNNGHVEIYRNED